MNKVLNIVLILLTLGSIYTAYKTKKKEGLYLLITILTIISLLFSFKIGNVFSYTSSINLPIYMGVLLIIYIFIDKYDLKETKKLINYIFIISVIAALFIITLAFYTQGITDNVSANFKTNIVTNVLSLLSYTVCLFASGYIITKIYPVLKKEFGSIFISIMITSLISSLIDTCIFFAISFVSLQNTESAIYLIMANFAYKLLLTFTYYPLLHLVDYGKKKRRVKK